jgi:hypothetical protein
MLRLWRASRGRTSWGWDLLESLEADRCAVCRLALRSVDRFFGTVSYEATNDPEVRQRFVDGGGFCREHAWRYAEVTNDALGVGLLYQHLLRVAWRQGGLDVGVECVACVQRERAERDLARIVADELRREDFRRALAGAALCRRHAARAEPLLRAEGARELIAACSARIAGPAASGELGLGGALPASRSQHAMGGGLGVEVARASPPGSSPAAAGEGACAVCQVMLGRCAGRAGGEVCRVHGWARACAGTAVGAECADCQAERALADAASAERRCLNHTRVTGERWRTEAAAWVPGLLERLDGWVARQDYHRLGEADGEERGLPWQALYWTVGLTDPRAAQRLLPRFGLAAVKESS